MISDNNQNIDAWRDEVLSRKVARIRDKWTSFMETVNPYTHGKIYIKTMRMMIKRWKTIYKIISI